MLLIGAIGKDWAAGLLVSVHRVDWEWPVDINPALLTTAASGESFSGHETEPNSIFVARYCLRQPRG
jgi:hypothetical protein